LRRTRGASGNLANVKRKRRLAYGVHVVAHYQVFRIDLTDAQALQAVEPLKVGVGCLNAGHYAQRDCLRQVSPKEPLVAICS